MNVRTSLLGLILATLGAATGANGAIMHVTTSTAWEVSSDGGATYVPATDTGDWTFSNGQTVDYLWSNDPVQGGEQRFFRFNFNIPGTPTAASLYTIEDDDITSFKINGNTVLTDTDGVATTIDPPVNVFALAGLATGANSILVDFQNTFCCGAGLGADLVIEFSPRQAVPEPGSLALLGMGLFGMAALRRRR